MFALGGSSEEKVQPIQQNNDLKFNQKKAKFKKTEFRKAGFKKAGRISQGGLGVVVLEKIKAEIPVGHSKDETAKEEIATRTAKEEPVFDDVFFETDEDDIDESAVDDYDSSDWEDTIEDSQYEFDEALFQRIDSRPSLSRISLITMMLKGEVEPPAIRQKSQAPNSTSLATSESELSEILGSAPQPAPHQLVLSPRTTRRNMLASELTASLRQHLLWEHKQRPQTAKAVLKRRHTAHDVTNPRQCPELVYSDNEDLDDAQWTWKVQYGQGRDYNSLGW